MFASPQSADHSSNSVQFSDDYSESNVVQSNTVSSNVAPSNTVQSSAIQPDKLTSGKSSSTQSKLPFWRSRRFLIPLFLFCSFLIAFYFLYLRGTPLEVSPKTTIITEPLTADGKAVDFRKRYRDEQDAWLNPPEENGFRLLLQAFGPRVLEQGKLADEVPWDEIATHENSKEWFSGHWTQLCQKFEIDPNTQPTFLERPSLLKTLMLNGTGVLTENKSDEKNSDENAENILSEDRFSKNDSSFVWIDYKKVPARMSDQEASDIYGALCMRPWKAEDCPTAARWIEENADIYAVYEKALEQPKFGSWHFVGDKPFDFIAVLLPDVQAMREVARQLSIRANYRIGTGDIDGALADQRLIWRLSRCLLDNPNSCLIEYLVGIAVYCVGESLSLNGNPDSLLTAQQWAQSQKNRDEIFNDFDFETAWERASNGERFMFFLPTIQDFAITQAKDRLNLLSSLDGLSSQEPANQLFLRQSFSWLLFSGLDTNAFMKRFNENWDKSIADEALAKDRASKIPGNFRGFFSPSRKRRSEFMADIISSLILPAMEKGHEAFFRCHCLDNLSRLKTAMLQYQAENGTLPPAFTVDENGQPLQSWRVLILPYLGAEEKALYNKIRLNEPWNSEYNRAFQANAPSIFRCPSHPFDAKGQETTNLIFERYAVEMSKIGPGCASYAVIVGPNSLFDRSGTGKNLSELVKNPDKNALGQILIAEQIAPNNNWMNPESEIDEEKVLENGINGQSKSAPLNTGIYHPKGIASFHPGGVMLAFADGSIQFISATTPLHINNEPPQKSGLSAKDYSLENMIFGTFSTQQEQNATEFDSEILEP